MKIELFAINQAVQTQDVLYIIVITNVKIARSGLRLFYFSFLFYFIFNLFSIFQFLEQLGLGLIGHAIMI